MQLKGWLLLIGCGWLSVWHAGLTDAGPADASEAVDLSSPAGGDPHAQARPAHPDELGWRRTRTGWEHQRWWTNTTRCPQPRLHPLLVGLLELLLSVAALVAFPSLRSARGSSNSASAPTTAAHRPHLAKPPLFSSVRTGSPGQHRPRRPDPRSR